MTRIFIELPSFRANWKTLNFSDDDLRRLQSELLTNPKLGNVMRETGGIRKLRFSYENRRKSGSVRVIYIDFVEYKKIFLLTAYPKNEKDNLNKSERNELHSLVSVLEEQLKRNFKKGE
ncbi:MAG: type II toxin-antitoxin system RelE/ParE family toxin [Eubacteriales bacterium]